MSWEEEGSNWCKLGRCRSRGKWSDCESHLRWPPTKKKDLMFNQIRLHRLSRRLLRHIFVYLQTTFPSWVSFKKFLPDLISVWKTSQWVIDAFAAANDDDGSTVKRSTRVKLEKRNWVGLIRGVWRCMTTRSSTIKILCHGYNSHLSVLLPFKPMGHKATLSLTHYHVSPTFLSLEHKGGLSLLLLELTGQNFESTINNELNFIRRVIILNWQDHTWDVFTKPLKMIPPSEPTHFKSVEKISLQSGNNRHDFLNRAERRRRNSSFLPQFPKLPPFPSFSQKLSPQGFLLLIDMSSL